MTTTDSSPTPETAPQPDKGTWMQWLPLAAAALALIALYGRTFWSMVDIWINSPTFAHGFAVPVIAGWLAWNKRDKLAHLSPRPVLAMLVPALLAGAAWMAGVFGEVNALAQFGAVAMLLLLVPAIGGLNLTRVLIFPLGFVLAFAVPVGEFLMPQLMQSTADFTVAALNFTGVPVYREGQQLVIPSGNWSVVEACSGIRYLIASLMVGTLYAYLNYYGIRRRIAFIAFSAVVPVVANWLRAYMVVMIGHLSSNKLATGVDHIIYGWVFFGIVMALMFWAGSFWYDPEQPEAPLPAETAPPVTTGTLWLAALTTIAVMAAPKTLESHLQAEQLAASEPSIQALAAVPGWQNLARPLAPFKPIYSGMADTLETSFQQGGKLVGVHLAYYRHQNKENKLVSSNNLIARVDGQEWVQVTQASRPSGVTDPSLNVVETEIRFGKSDMRLATWHWYWIGGRMTDSEYLAKAYTALSRITGQGDDAALILIYSPLERNNGERETLKGFLQAALPAIRSSLEATRAKR